MSATLNINADAVIKHTYRLQKIGRNALPRAVASSLSKTAFDVKTNTMPASAKDNFVQRKPTFFKANSKVVPAKGLNIAEMEATVGFVPKGGTDKSVDDLQQQEHGGSIGGRSFVPLAQARAGGSWDKVVKSKLRIKAVLQNIADAADAPGSSDKEKFIQSALHVGKGGMVIGTTRNSKGNKTVSVIRSIVRKGKNTIVKSVPLYSLEKGRKVKPRATHFMQSASETSAKKLEQFYITEAKKQLDRVK